MPVLLTAWVAGLSQYPSLAPLLSSSVSLSVSISVSFPAASLAFAGSRIYDFLIVQVKRLGYCVLSWEPKADRWTSTHHHTIRWVAPTNQLWPPGDSKRSVATQSVRH